MAIFCWTLLSRAVFRTQPKVYSGAFLQNSQQLLAINVFCKKVPPLMFDCVLKMPLSGACKEKRNYLI